MYCETKSKFGRPKMIFNYHEVKNKLPNTHKYHYYYYHLQSIYHCCMYHIISYHSLIIPSSLKPFPIIIHCIFLNPLLNFSINIIITINKFRQFLIQIIS